MKRLDEARDEAGNADGEEDDSENQRKIASVHGMLSPMCLFSTRHVFLGSQIKPSATFTEAISPRYRLIAAPRGAPFASPSRHNAGRRRRARRRARPGRRR